MLISEVEALQLQPDELLVLRMPAGATAPDIVGLMQRLAKTPFHRRTLAVAGNVEISTAMSTVAWASMDDSYIPAWQEMPGALRRRFEAWMWLAALNGVVAGAALASLLWWAL